MKIPMAKFGIGNCVSPKPTAPMAQKQATKIGSRTPSRWCYTMTLHSRNKPPRNKREVYSGRRELAASHTSRLTGNCGSLPASAAVI